MEDCTSKAIIITIDGGCGTGKTTLGVSLQEFLERNNYGAAVCIKSGLLYRAFALNLCNNRPRLAQRLRSGGDITEEKVKTLIDECRKEGLCLLGGKAAYKTQLVDEKLLRQDEISQFAAKLAKLGNVRAYLNEIVQNCIDSFEGFIILDGRGCASEFPDALMHVYLTASDEVAAVRQGISVEQVRGRNGEDATRELAPMIRNPDAYVVNTDSMSENEVLVCVRYELIRRLPAPTTWIG